MRLNELPPYGAGRIASVGECPAKRRLESMGVRAGALVTRLFSSVFADPAAYSVDHAVIGIRSEDAARITVEALDSGRGGRKNGFDP